jgi:hypothetical protein
MYPDSRWGLAFGLIFVCFWRLPARLFSPIANRVFLFLWRLHEQLFSSALYLSVVSKGSLTKQHVFSSVAIKEASKNRSKSRVDNRGLGNYHRE